MIIKTIFFQKILGKVEIKYIEGRPGDFPGKEILTNQAKEELGWEPKVTFEEGIRRYIKWFKANQESLDAEWARLDETLKQ